MFQLIFFSALLMKKQDMINQNKYILSNFFKMLVTFASRNKNLAPLSCHHTDCVYFAYRVAFLTK